MLQREKENRGILDKREKESLYQRMNDQENIARIIYMWRRYKGQRCPDEITLGIQKLKVWGKIFTFADIDELERRIELYFKHKKKFNWDRGEVMLLIDGE
jgi:hypothetical protein